LALNGEVLKKRAREWIFREAYAEGITVEKARLIRKQKSFRITGR